MVISEALREKQIPRGARDDEAPVGCSTSTRLLIIYGEAELLALAHDFQTPRIALEAWHHFAIHKEF